MEKKVKELKYTIHIHIPVQQFIIYQPNKYLAASYSIYETAIIVFVTLLARILSYQLSKFDTKKLKYPITEIDTIEHPTVNDTEVIHVRLSLISDDKSTNLLTILILTQESCNYATFKQRLWNEMEILGKNCLKNTNVNGFVYRQWKSYTKLV